MTDLLLGVDAGLTTTTAVVFDTDGETVATASRETPTDRPATGHREVALEDLWETVADAIAILKEFGVSQMPVFREGVHDEARADDIIGSVRENALLDAALRDAEVMSKPIIEVLQPPLPVADAVDPLDHVLGELAGGAPAVVAQRDGRAVGVLTRADLLTYLAGKDGR